ncbi:uncharacterized protein LOC108473700 [Gossypium arboreum]|uniref:uncharacterized protein LOC108473700 n=1 Tax=Gossypium arboreum TaxID=29729 RepID=UPI0008192BC5|nr:uncharacterized protein LOC108473700 [Gossypium arboreum]
MDPDRTMADDIESNALAPTKGAVPSDNRPPTTLVSVVPQERVTWEFFKEEFQKKYSSERFIDQKRKEFLDLKQGRMTVTEYEREFVRLSKYARVCVSSEAKMCRRFEDGLNKDIRLSVGALKLKEFVVFVDRACKAEKLIKENKKIEAKTRDARKRNASKSFPSQSKKSKDAYSRSHASTRHSYRDRIKQDSDFKSQATSVASVGNVRSSKPECQHCGRNHFDKCRMNDGSYFRCSSQDHFIKDCPKMIDKEKFQGTRPSGTNSKGRLQKNVGTGASSNNMTRDTIIRSKARAQAKTYVIRVREDASSLDVITDTFSVYDNTAIKLKCENGETLWVESGEPRNLPIVIFLMSAQKYLRKGCEAYFAFVMNKKESELKVESVPVVSEYVDVFPEELPRLPPIREVKFGMELILGTTPILIAPYRMTPIELKELKS